ncbi:hypothetical protein [Endozoicomonas euniceicola]|uniref:Uncharacterized protein n=1 Tax=Endozoicomonas euniceicola TaxID=1234143 RepID=A0ABY6GXC0_9GAMM|nr:hypothetical protein [Endozoicomonas euniceicola]UYM17019.1 hypothetical protein NX720_03575 [Endozoicomonas euniceicola]
MSTSHVPIQPISPPITASAESTLKTSSTTDMMDKHMNIQVFKLAKTLSAGVTSMKRVIGVDTHMSNQGTRGA